MVNLAVLDPELPEYLFIYLLYLSPFYMHFEFTLALTKHFHSAKIQLLHNRNI